MFKVDKRNPRLEMNIFLCRFQQETSLSGKHLDLILQILEMVKITLQKTRKTIIQNQLPGY